MDNHSYTGLKCITKFEEFKTTINWKIDCCNLLEKRKYIRLESAKFHIREYPTPTYFSAEVECKSMNSDERKYDFRIRLNIESHLIPVGNMINSNVKLFIRDDTCSNGEMNKPHVFSTNFRNSDRESHPTMTFPYHIQIDQKNLSPKAYLWLQSELVYVKQVNFDKIMERIKISKLMHNISKCFMKRNWSDVLVKVEHLDIPAHKVILGARSDVFRAMLTHDMRENQTNVIQITDTNYRIFIDILEYIYLKEFVFISPMTQHTLQRIADMYNLEELVYACSYTKDAESVAKDHNDLTLITTLAEHETEFEWHIHLWNTLTDLSGIALQSNKFRIQGTPRTVYFHGSVNCSEPFGNNLLQFGLRYVDSKTSIKSDCEVDLHLVLSMYDTKSNQRVPKIKTIRMKTRLELNRSNFSRSPSIAERLVTIALPEEKISSETCIFLQCNFVHTNCLSHKEKLQYDKHKRIIKDFSALLLNEQWSDVQIKIADETFHAHKVILAARSTVFENMLTQDAEDGSILVLNVSDVEPQTFKKMLEYIYTGRVDNVPEVAIKLSVAAEKYDLTELKNACSDILLKNSICEDVFEIPGPEGADSPGYIPSSPCYTPSSPSYNPTLPSYNSQLLSYSNLRIIRRERSNRRGRNY